MKKTWKKIVGGMLAMSLFLTACGSNSSSNPASSGTSTNGSLQSASQTTGKKVEIEYWHVNAETQGGVTVEELVKKFNESQDEIHVTARYNPDMYKGLMQNLQAEQAAGKSPAIVQVGWAFLDYFSNNFAYLGPEEAIQKYDSENADYLSKTFLPNVLSLAKNSKDEQVGLPYSLSTPVLYINKDLLKEAGVDENGPKTWQEVRDFAKTIKEKTGKYGLYVQEPADFWGQQAILESNGGRMITDGKASFNSPEGVEAMQLYADMVNQDQSALHISWDEGVQSFIDGSTAMLYTTIARRASIQKGAQFEVAAVVSPSFGDRTQALPAGGCFLAITATDEKEQKAAWTFEKFLYENASLAAWTIGTGYVPPAIGVDTAEDGLKGFLEENKMMIPAITQMDKLVSWASFPGDAGLQAEQLLLDMRDAILGGEKDAATAMKETQNAINELLK